jgi:hypothetical protein
MAPLAGKRLLPALGPVTHSTRLLASLRCGQLMPAMTKFQHHKAESAVSAQRLLKQHMSGAVGSAMGSERAPTWWLPLQVHPP